METKDPPAEPETEPVPCPRCGSTTWRRYQETRLVFDTILDTGELPPSEAVIDEHYTCNRCDSAATAETDERISAWIDAQGW